MVFSTKSSTKTRLGLRILQSIRIVHFIPIIQIIRIVRISVPTT